MIWIGAGIGVLVTFPANYINTDLGSYLETGRPWLDTVTECFLVIGPNEELLKLGGLLWLFHRHTLHQRPLELVGCALAIGLGVGAIENWAYVAYHPDDNVDNRLLALPVHPMLTGIAATYLALGDITQKHRWRYRMLAIMVPILLHGAIDLPYQALERNLDFPLGDMSAWVMISVVITVFLTLLSKLQHSLVGGSRYTVDWAAIGQVAAGSFGLFYVLRFAFLLGWLGSHAAPSLNDQRMRDVSIDLFGFLIEGRMTDMQLLLYLGAVLVVAFILSGLFLLLLRQAWRRLFALPFPEA